MKSMREEVLLHTLLMLALYVVFTTRLLYGGERTCSTYGHGACEQYFAGVFVGMCMPFYRTNLYMHIYWWFK